MEYFVERVLVIKARTSWIEKIVNLVKQKHRYGVPEIIATPVAGGNPDHLAGIDREVHGELGGQERDVECGRTSEV